MTTSQLWLRYMLVGLHDGRAGVMQLPIEYQAVKVTASGNKAIPQTLSGISPTLDRVWPMTTPQFGFSVVWVVSWIYDEGGICAVAQSLPQNWDGISI